MADRMLYRYGETNPVMFAVDSAQVIEIGDLVWLNTDDIRAASALTYTTPVNTRESFVDNFMGVAMQRSKSGETAEIRVATSGVFEFDCASATFEANDKVTIDDNAGGTALEDQKVIASGTDYDPIGKVAKRVASAATKVLVDIRTQFGTPIPAATASS